MSARTDVLSRRASAEREDLLAAFDALEREVGALADWRAYVRREPVMTLGIAALGGAILGAASAPRRRTARSPMRSTLLEAGEAVVGTAASAALLRRMGVFLLDLVVARALAAYKGEGNSPPAATTAHTGHARETQERSR